MADYKDNLPQRLAEGVLLQRLAECGLPQRLAECVLPQRLAERVLPQRLADLCESWLMLLLESAAVACRSPFTPVNSSVTCQQNITDN